MRIKRTKFFAYYTLPFLMLTLISCKADRGPRVDQAWQVWIKANHNAIRSIDADDRYYSDLQFLRPLLAGRRLAQLGECSHGVSEFDKAKVRLIKYLHEELGFDVIAFESPIFECFAADMEASLPETSAQDMMLDSIFPVWHCTEALELFSYLKEDKQGPNPLILAGFDIQVSYLEGSKKRPPLFREAVAKIDPVYAEEVYQNDQTFVNNCYDKQWLPDNARSFKEFYNSLYQWFDEHLAALMPAYPGSPLLPQVLRQTAWSMTLLIEELTSSGNNGIKIRDKGMADNLAVLADQYYPDKKIIIWAHNLHIDHDAGERYGDPSLFSMGYWLEQRYGPLLYTIGLYMYEGKAAGSGLQVYVIWPPPDNSLEAILYYTAREYAFVDMLNQANTPGASWMYQKIPAREGEEKIFPMIPRDHFDAVLFIKTVNPPDYIK